MCFKMLSSNGHFFIIKILQRKIYIFPFLEVHLHPSCSILHYKAFDFDHWQIIKHLVLHYDAPVMVAVTVSAVHLAFFLEAIKLRQLVVGHCYITLLECISQDSVMSYLKQQVAEVLIGRNTILYCFKLTFPFPFTKKLKNKTQNTNQNIFLKVSTFQSSCLITFFTPFIKYQVLERPRPGLTKLKWPRITNHQPTHT